jgi:hypothetical protein
MRTMIARKTDNGQRQDADFVAAGVALQEQGLAVLLAEMRALASLMTGANAHGPTPDEAETEAAFDNMPV